MDKIHPTKLVKLDDDDKLCGKCTSPLFTAAVKCDQCKELFHLKCSKMPIHLLIKYFTSRITYNCEECVKANTEGYEEILGWVNDLGAGAQPTSDDVSKQDKTTSTEQTTSHYQEPISRLENSIAELRAEMHSLTQKVTTDGKQKLFSHVLQSTKDSQQLAENKKTRGMVEANQQAVFIKRKSGSTVTKEDNDQIVTALKSVPTVSMRNVTEDTVKLVFPNSAITTQAVEALGKTPNSNQYELAHQKKLRPKLAVTYVPDSIVDSDLNQIILDKNTNITELIDEENEIKVLTSKPSAPGFKTVILGVSPRIRNAVMKNGGYIYLHMSRCHTYDHYWALRCGNCSQYGHKAEKCTQLKPRCGFCAGEHRSNDCTTKDNLKCCHCADADRPQTAHSVFNIKCPAFLEAKNRVIRRTMTCEEDIYPKN